VLEDEIKDDPETTDFEGMVKHDEIHQISL
jgi:hypothetical protein